MSEKNSSGNIIESMKVRQKQLVDRGFISSDGGEHNLKDKYANIYMTGLKTLYPLVHAVAAKQIEVTTEQDLLSQISKMFIASNELAKHIVSDLQSVGINPYEDKNRWALRKILSLSTSSIATNWMRYNNTDVSVISRLYSNLIIGLTGEVTKAEKAHIDDTGLNQRMADNSREFELLQDVLVSDDYFQKTDVLPALSVSIMSAMQPIIFEIERFNWFQDKNESIEIATKKVIEGAQYLFNNYFVANDKISSDSKKMLLQSCIGKSAGLYAECWRSKAQDDLFCVQEMSPEDRSAWVQKVKNTPLSMKEIEVSYENMLGYMAAAATKGMNYIKQVLIDNGFDVEQVKKPSPAAEKC